MCLLEWSHVNSSVWHEVGGRSVLAVCVQLVMFRCVRVWRRRSLQSVDECWMTAGGIWWAAGRRWQTSCGAVWSDADHVDVFASDDRRRVRLRRGSWRGRCTCPSLHTSRQERTGTVCTQCKWAPRCHNRSTLLAVATRCERIMTISWAVLTRARLTDRRMSCGSN